MDIDKNSAELLPMGLHVDAIPPVFCRESGVDWRSHRDRLDQAVQSWLMSSPSEHTLLAYSSDLRQFLRFHEIEVGHWEELTEMLPADVSGWRDSLIENV